MYNIGARYEIVGRVLSGTTVSAYVLKDILTGKVNMVEKCIVEQLALNKQIYNCSGQIYKSIINLKGIGCKLNQLPRYDNRCMPIVDDDKDKRKITADLELIGKVQKGRAVVAYRVRNLRDKGSKPVIISRDKVIELARSGRIINAKCQMNGSDIMLRGIPGVNLAQLESYQLK